MPVNTKVPLMCTSLSILGAVVTNATSDSRRHKRKINRMARGPIMGIFLSHRCDRGACTTWHQRVEYRQQRAVQQLQRRELGVHFLCLQTNDVVVGIQNSWPEDGSPQVGAPGFFARKSRNLKGARKTSGAKTRRPPSVVFLGGGVSHSSACNTQALVGHLIGTSFASPLPDYSWTKGFLQNCAPFQYRQLAFLRGRRNCPQTVQMQLVVRTFPNHPTRSDRLAPAAKGEGAGAYIVARWP